MVPFVAVAILLGWILTGTAAAVTYHAVLGQCVYDSGRCKADCDHARRMDIIMGEHRTSDVTPMAKWKACQEECEATFARCKQEVADLFGEKSD